MGHTKAKPVPVGQAVDDALQIIDFQAVANGDPHGDCAVRGAAAHFVCQIDNAKLTGESGLPK